MRLLHEVIDDLHHHADEHAIIPISYVLEDLLDGERASPHDLADAFTQVGLAPIMASWTGQRPDLPVTPEQLRHVMGEKRVQGCGHSGRTAVRGPAGSALPHSAENRSCHDARGRIVCLTIVS